MSTHQLMDTYQVNTKPQNNLIFHCNVKFINVSLSTPVYSFPPGTYSVLIDETRTSMLVTGLCKKQD